MYPSKQDLERKRLDDIVIRTRAQSLHFIAWCIPRSEHEYRELLVSRPQALQHFKAIEARHHHIEDHKIRGALTRDSKPFSTRCGSINRKPFIGQTTLQQAGHSRIIINYQNALHHRSPPRESPDGLCNLLASSLHE